MCVHACMCGCVLACVRACVCACGCVHVHSKGACEPEVTGADCADGPSQNTTFLNSEYSWKRLSKH